MERVQKILDQVSTSKNIERSVDLKDLIIDESIPASERIRRYIELVGDPYRFKVGTMKVEVCFTKGGQTLQKLIENLILDNIAK